jgi:hypothetical protein
VASLGVLYDRVSSPLRYDALDDGAGEDVLTELRVKHVDIPVVS